jgi:(2R)-3-sulfolactate dehydrogenase (NADP+)
MTIRLSIQQVQDRAAAVLEANRTSAENALSVARALVLAQADGLKGHGLIRLSTYAAQAKLGKIDGFARPSAIKRAPGACIIDAKDGFAYPAIDLAIEMLTAMTSSQGIAAAAITHSGHCGAMGLVVERLAEANLAAIMVANTPAAMAPWGGSTALFGTNPIACAFPRPNDEPVVIDLSLSKVARGQVLAAKQKGETIPDDWALDTNGEPTNDPQAALAGTMLPIGGAKGAALALMVEALAAGLTGSNFASSANSFLDAEGPPSGTGQLIIALAPEAFGPGLDHMDQLFTAVSGQSGTRLPGDRRRACRARSRREGLDVEEAWFGK